MAMLTRLFARWWASHSAARERRIRDISRKGLAAID